MRLIEESAFETGIRFQNRADQRSVSAADVHQPVGGAEIVRLHDGGNDTLPERSHREVEDFTLPWMSGQIVEELDTRGSLERGLSGLDAVHSSGKHRSPGRQADHPHPWAH